MSMTQMLFGGANPRLISSLYQTTGSPPTGFGQVGSGAFYQTTITLPAYTYCEWYVGSGANHAYTKFYSGAGGAPAGGTSLTLSLDNRGIPGTPFVQICVGTTSNQSPAMSAPANGAAGSSFPNSDLTTVLSPADTSSAWLIYRVYQ